MAMTVKGFDGMTLVRTRKGWSRADGETLIDEYEGPRSKGDALYDTLKTDPAVTSLSLEPDGVSSKLEVTRPDPDIQTTETDNAFWEVDGVEALKDIRTHPFFNPSMSIALNIAQIDKAIDNGTSYDFASSGFEYVLRRYYALREAGVTSYYSDALLLRKKIVLTSESAIVANYSSINRKVDLSTINPPSQLLGTLSQLPIYSYAIDSTVPSISAGQWEWLKRRPKIRQQGKSKFELSYEWLGSQSWSKVLYGGSWDPVA